MAEEINTARTDELTCPYCGRVNTEGHLMFHRSECRVIQCDNCDREFDAVQHISVSYTTTKLQGS